MQIQLLSYERRTLESLEQMYHLDRELVVGLALSLNSLKDLFVQAIENANGEFRAGRVVIIGLVNHAHHLLNGGLEALHSGNGTVWSACVRGLMETFGACVLISEKPGTVPNFLENIKPGKLRNAAERAKPGLGKDIKRLNEIVHPVSGAIYAGFKIADDETKTAKVVFGIQQLEQDEGTEGFIVLANMADLLVERLTDLFSKPDVLAFGKKIMVTVSANA